MTYPELTTTIEAGAVAAFAESLGAPTEDVPPPTFAAVYALFPTFRQLLEDPAAGIDLAMLVHSEQEFEWTRHPEVGEGLRVRGEVTEDVTRRGMRLVTMLATCHDERGLEVCRSRMVCLIRPRS